MSADQLVVPAFVPSIIGDVVAGVGMITGVAALVRQILTRTRGADRVAEASPDIQLIGASAGTAGRYIQVILRNRGAAPVDVESWFILLDDGSALFVIPARFPPNPKLPLSLAAGASVSFYTLASEIKKATGRRDLSRARRGTARHPVKSSEQERHHGQDSVIGTGSLVSRCRQSGALRVCGTSPCRALGLIRAVPSQTQQSALPEKSGLRTERRARVANQTEGAHRAIPLGLRPRQPIPLQSGPTKTWLLNRVATR